MKFTFLNKYILLTAFVCCFFSCSSDLDFEQVDDFKIEPVVTTNLAYIKGDASNFISNGSESPLINYYSSVDFLRTSFLQKDLIKADLYFRIKNTIPRAFTYNVTFLNEINSPIYSLTMNVPAYNGTEIVFKRTETFTPVNIDVLKNTATMVFSVLMLPGTPITATTPGRIELSSSITAYFEVE